MRESIKKGRNRIGFSLFASDFDEVRKSVSAFRALQTALKAGGGQRVLSTSGRDEVSGLKKADSRGRGKGIPGDCFKAGTQVRTKEGYKNIEDIEVGDEVLAYDEETGEQGYKPVVRLFRNQTKEWCTVSVRGNDGEIYEITSTPGHKYFLPENKEYRNSRALEHESYAGLNEKWVSACDLKRGDKVQLSDGTLCKVERVALEQLEEPETTYNLEVADFHTYYVGIGILVHNANCGFNSKTVWESEKVGRYKNVRIDVEINPMGKVDIHMQAKNLPKMHYSNGGFPTAPNALANADVVKKGIVKALNYIKRRGWKIE